jgi:hypothetical protein
MRRGTVEKPSTLETYLSEREFLNKTTEVLKQTQEYATALTEVDLI